MSDATPVSISRPWGGEHARIPLNRIGGLYKINLNKTAIEAKDVNSDAANFKAQANADFTEKDHIRIGVLLVLLTLSTSHACTKENRIR